MFTLARDADAVVVVTVHGPLTPDDRPVLCRAVEDQLRRHAARRVVVDFGPGELGPTEVSAALRIDHICAARDAACAVVTGDRDRLRLVVPDDAPPGQRLVVASDLAAALTGDP